MAIYKEAEFQTFLNLIEGGQIQHWVEIAKIIGVDKNTISAWKKLPEAQNAILEGISSSLSKMEQAGKNDWRMYEAKLRMLGLSDKPELKVQFSNDPAEEVLKKMGLLDEKGEMVDLK